MFDTFGATAYYSDMDRTDYMSTADAAKLLSVSRQTLYNWINEGKVPEPSRHPETGHMRWKPEDIQRIRVIQQELEGAE